MEGLMVSLFFNHCFAYMIADDIAVVRSKYTSLIKGCIVSFTPVIVRKVRVWHSLVCAQRSITKFRTVCSSSTEIKECPKQKVFHEMDHMDLVLFTFSWVWWMMCLRNSRLFTNYIRADKINIGWFYWPSLAKNLAKQFKSCYSTGRVNAPFPWLSNDSLGPKKDLHTEFMLVFEPK